MERELEQFARGGPEAGLAVPVLAHDPALVRAVQARLSHHGLLDPPADGFLGPVSQWALAEFCRARGLAFEGSLTRLAAAALLDRDPALPLKTGGGELAARLAAALARRGDWICRHPACVTIAYVEGLESRGRARERRPDGFDDLRLLLRIAPGGRPELAGVWDATADAGRPATDEPAEPEGAPRLLPGQHKAWVIGRTAIGTSLEQEALVQVSPLPVTRDADRDFRRAGDRREEGFFVLDQHGGLDAPHDAVGGVGAGCLVGRRQAEHRLFMAALRGDARFRASHAYRFMTSLLTAEEFGAA